MRANPGEQFVAFGDFRFDQRSAILSKRGIRIRVPGQSLAVLAVLLENAGETVSREQLRLLLWPNGTHVEFEQGLNSVLKRLRAALADSHTAPRYIETLPKRGYRFICPLEQSSAKAEPLATNLPIQPSNAAAPIFRIAEMHPEQKRGIQFRIGLLLAFLSIVVLAAALYKEARGRLWAHETAIPRALLLAANGEFGPAYDLACAAAFRLPGTDPQLERLWPVVSRNITVLSDPPGAAVFWRPYTNLESPWRPLGKTSLQNGRVAAGAVRLRLTEAGYADLEIAAAGSKYQLRLEKADSQPGMVHIPPGPLFAQYAGIGRLGPLTINAFWMDRTEVTNSEYQRFVNAGGYQNPQHWKVSIVDNGRTLSWNEAMARFVDRTGRRSPANWTAGGYPAGEADYPVSGVSWYEAAAYADFAGKAIPNVYQWFRAAATDDSAFIIALSNFNHHRPVSVRSWGALGSFGAYDMAGNVREWCFNESGGQRFILGGAWADPAYMFTRGQKLPPLNRSLMNGFRCVRSFERVAPQQQLAAPIPAHPFDRTTLSRASDEVFAASRALYAYEHTDLHAVVESTTDSELWRRQKVRFQAGYSNQQLIAYLFLPKQRRPPYQCVVFVPSGDAFQAKPGDAIQPEEYILRSGRAMMYPIFWGTYDRFATMPPDPANAGYPSPMFIRECLIAWKRELGRSIDYLQTRKDIGQIGYLGASSGAEFAPVLLAEERRVRAAVLLSGGMPAPHMRLMPESDSANFAARVTIPVLMLNGRYDSVLPLEVQDSMFRLLGTPAANKARILVDSGHGVFAPEVANKTVHETLAWLDRYLGSP